MKFNIVFTAVVWFVSIAKGSKMTFSATPATVTPALTSDVTLTCSLHDTSPPGSGGLVGRDIHNVTETPSNIQFVTSVSILHNGARVASVTEHHPARSLTQWSNMAVDGGVGTTTEVKGFLNLTLQYPTADQLGRYECQISGADPTDDHDVMFTTSLDLTNDANIITQLMDHIRILEIDSRAQRLEVAGMKQELEDLKKVHASSYNALSTSIKNTRHIESGSVTCGSNPMMSRNHITANFSTPYTGAPPLVYVSVGEFRIHVIMTDIGTSETGTYIGVSGHLGHVDMNGFSFICDTLGLSYGPYRSYVSHQDMKWISFPTVL